MFIRAVSPNTWYEVDLTSHIIGDGTYSLRVSDSTGGADYSSKEGSNAPKLLVAVAGATPQSCAPAATATPSPIFTSTPTKTPTNTFTPTSTNTPTGVTPIPNCGQVTHGTLTRSGSTLTMTITNPTGVALVMQNVTVT